MTETWEKILGLIEKSPDLSPLARRSFEKGQFLLHQNEKSRHAFVLQKGKVRVFREQGGWVAHIEDLGPGEILGELSLIDGGPRSASAVALEPVEAVIVSAKDYEDIQEKLPIWIPALARSLSHRLRTVLSHIEREPDSYLHSSVVSLLIYKVVAENDRLEFNRPELIKELSGILRVEEQNIADHLNRLAVGNYLKMSSEKILIHSLQNLEKLQKELHEHSLNDKSEACRP